MICVNRDREYLAEAHLDSVGYEVSALAKRADVGYLIKRLGRDECIAIGNLALVEAAQTFDFNRGVLFSTYAGAAIRKSVLSAASDNPEELTNVDIDVAAGERPALDEREFLQRELPELSAIENAVMQLRGLQQLPLSEVARRTGMSSQHVWDVMERASKKLRLTSGQRTV